METTQLENQVLSLRKTLVSNIKRFRKELHLTREMFAENADISMSYLADIERCRTWVSDKTLVKLASALYKKPFELLLSDEAENDVPAIAKEKQITDVIFTRKKEVLHDIRESFDRTLQEVLSVMQG